MKLLKTYLIIVSIFLAISIGAGIYVWYLYQKVEVETKAQSYADEYKRYSLINEISRFY